MPQAYLRTDEACAVVLNAVRNNTHLVNGTHSNVRSFELQNELDYFHFMLFSTMICVYICSGRRFV